jgi:hypothetical protein
MRPFASAVRRLLAAFCRPFAWRRGPRKSAPGGAPPRTGPEPEREDFLLVLLRALSGWGT